MSERVHSARNEQPTADNLHGQAGVDSLSDPLPIDPSTHDVYIGRVAEASEDFVTALGQTTDPDKVVSFDGRLVVPLMYRRQLAQCTEPLAVARRVLHDAIAPHHRIPLRVAFHPLGIRQQHNGTMTIYAKPRTHRLQLEHNATDVRAALVRHLPYTKDVSISNGQPVLRLYETTVLNEAKEVARIAQELIGDTVMCYTFNIPSICSVLKK